MFKKGDFIGFDKRYKVLEVLGKGGMGSVLKAYDTFLKRYVAIKTLHEKYSTNTRATNMFLNEAITCTTLTHENIIKVYDANSFNGIYYMVMEYIEGKDLKHWLDRHNDIADRDAKKMIKVIIPILRALKYAHSYTIHRDIKPANIMIGKGKNKKSRIVLMDFGIAKAIENSDYDNQTVMGAMGTRNYMSPEQAFNASNIDKRSDIYSLGVVFYEMLTTRKPINSSIGKTYPPSRYNPTVPKELDKIVLKMIEEKRDNRFNSVDEILIKLLQILKKLNEKTDTIFTMMDIPTYNEEGIIEENRVESKFNNEFEDKKENNFIETITIPEGKFWRGSGEESQIENEKPRKEVFLDEFKIGKYAVSNEEYAKFLEETNYQKPKNFDKILKKYPKRPVVNVSWRDAKKFCEWCKGDLPTEAQWEKSATGPNNYIYPWGDELDVTKANINSSELVNVDEFEDGASGYGCYQMVGNVWEWCLDDYKKDFYKDKKSFENKNPVCKIINSQIKVIKGCAYDFIPFASRVAFRLDEKEDTKAHNIGFRVVFNQ